MWLCLASFAIVSSAAAAVELRYERTFELDGQESSRGTVTAWIEGDRARYDSHVGPFFYSGETETLTHVRPDDTAVKFELPIRFDQIASPEDLETLEAFRGMIDGETEVRAEDETRVIAGQQARLVEIVTVLHVGGRIETRLWVATGDEIASGPFLRLLGGVRDLMVGLEPWLEVAAAEKLLPLEVVTTTTGNGPHRTETLRLVAVETTEASLAERFELPAGVELVPFAMKQYFQVHR